MAPPNEIKESKHKKGFLPSQSTQFKAQWKPPRISSFVKQLSDARKNGDHAKFNELRRIWPLVSDYYTAKAKLMRLSRIGRLCHEARMKVHCAYFSNSCLEMPVGSAEWIRWVKEVEKQEYPVVTSKEEDNQSEQSADVMDTARLLRIMHLDVNRHIATKSGDATKAAVLLQAMKETFKSGGDECRVYIENAKECLIKVGVPKECEFMLKVYPRLLEAKENGDLAKANELLHLAQLEYFKVKVKAFSGDLIMGIFYEARVRSDDAKATQLLSSMQPVPQQNGQVWRMSTMVLQRHDGIFLAEDVVRQMQAYQRSFVDGAPEQCDVVEEYIFDGRKTVREMNNASNAEGNTQTSYICTCEMPPRAML